MHCITSDRWCQYIPRPVLFWSLSCIVYLVPFYYWKWVLGNLFIHGNIDLWCTWLLFSTLRVSFFAVQSSVMALFLQQGAWKIFSWSPKLLHRGLLGSWQNYFFQCRDGMFLCISEPPRGTESNEWSRSAALWCCPHVIVYTSLSQRTADLE